MKTLAHLSDAVLRRELIAAVARDRITTAELLAHIAEFDARKLYVPEGYSSMHAYCVGELHLSEDAAYKRIQAARAAREFPVLFEALAEGRLHLAAVCLLAPHLTHENVEQLTTAATHRRKTEVEDLIARRAVAFQASHGTLQLAPGQVGSLIAAGDLERKEGESSNGADPKRDELAPGQVGRPELPSSVPARYCPLHLRVPESTHEKLTYALALLSHAIPSGDVVQLLDRALDALIEKAEKRKLGAGSTRKARPALKRPQVRGRYVPVPIRRAVWERDGGRCTFVSKSGHRCGERRFLEFDHVQPVARGGTSTVNGLRLRCRAHNQYDAERVFGAGFMERKREGARLASAGNRSAAQNRARARTRAVAEEQAAQAVIRELTQDVLAGLRGLGCRVDEARRAAQFTETLGGASLEERMRAALGYISRRFTHGSASAG